MKKNKKISAALAAILLLVSITAGPFSAYAKSAFGSITCAGQGASCSLISDSKNTAKANTLSVYPFDSLTAYVLGCEVDKNGTVVRYKGITARDKTDKNSGDAIINTLSSTNKFENITSVHGVVKGSSEAVLNKPLELHW